MTLGFLGPLGTGEILVILIFALLMFGGKLPDVAKSLGRSVNQFKRGLKDLSDEVTAADAPKYVPPRSLPRDASARPALVAPVEAATPATPQPPIVAASTEAARSELAPGASDDAKTKAPAQE